MPVEELEKITNLKVKYVQVNASHKCIPWDTFLTFDSFVIYTMASLTMPTGATGYMNSYLRKKNSSNF